RVGGLGCANRPAEKGPTGFMGGVGKFGASGGSPAGARAIIATMTAAVAMNWCAHFIRSSQDCIQRLAKPGAQQYSQQEAATVYGEVPRRWCTSLSNFRGKYPPV